LVADITPGLLDPYDCSFHVSRNRPRQPNADQEMIYQLDFSARSTAAMPDSCRGKSKRS
jgi:hypothetical protein